MRSNPGVSLRVLMLAVLTSGLMLSGSTEAVAEEFQEALSRVDEALQKNPNKASRFALQTCQNRRKQAALLHYAGYPVRAERSLKQCFPLLGIPEDAEEAKRLAEAERDKRRAAALATARERAAKEYERALGLTPDIKHGLEIYRACAACHTPEGWGLAGGSVPQLAGQHRNVVIKQLADIRAGNRYNRMMEPYSSVEAIGGVQAVADVAGYIDTLEISIENGKGPADDLALGERLYRENCTRCHGAQGEGDNEKHIPRIQSQHYEYLVYQFELIRDGKRRNADPEMTKQIKGFEERDVHAVMAYVARLEPPEELQAPPGWRNPDFMQPIVAK